MIDWRGASSYPTLPYFSYFPSLFVYHFSFHHLFTSLFYYLFGVLFYVFFLFFLNILGLFTQQLYALHSHNKPKNIGKIIERANNFHLICRQVFKDYSPYNLIQRPSETERYFFLAFTRRHDILRFLFSKSFSNF